MHKVRLLFLFLFFAPLFSFAQKSGLPNGRFVEDSINIGDTVRFALSYRHNRALEVLFPDTSLRIPSFEILSKRYFPTQTSGQISLDSTIYILRTFEIEPVLYLSLPVYILQQNDSAVVYSSTDSINLVQWVKGSGEQLQLAENLTPLPLEQKFNYPYFFIGLALSLLLILVLFYLFGKPIKRLYERYMAQTKFKAFRSRYESLNRKFIRLQTVQALEEAVTLWKNYLTDLEEKPINSFTTKEIAEYYNEEELSEVLKLCDKAIYGGIIENDQNETSAALGLLKDFSVKRYHELQNKPADVVRSAA